MGTHLVKNHPVEHLCTHGEDSHCEDPPCEEQGPVKVERGLCEYSRAGPLTDMKVEFIKGLNQFMYTNADKII